MKKLTAGMSALVGEMVATNGFAIVSRGTWTVSRRNRMLALLKRGLVQRVERRGPDGDRFALTDAGWLHGRERARDRAKRGAL